MLVCRLAGCLDCLLRAAGALYRPMFCIGFLSDSTFNEYGVVTLVWQFQLSLASLYLIHVDLSISRYREPGVIDLFALQLRWGSGSTVCPYSNYSEPRILCGAP